MGRYIPQSILIVNYNSIITYYYIDMNTAYHTDIKWD